MTDSQAIAPHKPLSQIERVVYAFVSPSEMFFDVLRSQTFWLPLLLTIFFSYGFSATAVQTVGVNQIVTNMMHSDAQTQKRMAAVSPDQRLQYRALAVTILKWSMGLAPVLVLLFNVVIGAILLLSFNISFGANLTFNRVFCVLMYADLINNLRPFLTSVLLYFKGISPGGFDIQNPIPTNAAYFLSTHVNGALKSFLFSIDAITIWYLIVMSIGFSVVGRLRFGQAAAVVFGWWAFIVFARVAWAAITG